MSSDKRRLALLAGVTLTESVHNFGKKTLDNFDIWKAAVGRSSIVETAPGVFEASFRGQPVGSFSNNVRRGWIREDDVFGTEPQPEAQPSDDMASLDAEPAQPELDATPLATAASTDDLIFVRQLEDLHKQCSSEVSEIIDHFKKDGAYGSRARQDVDAVLELYKQLYVALFADH